MVDGSGAAAAPAQQPPPLPRAGRLPLSGQIMVSLLWFALFANWLTVVPVIVPDQIASILGPDAAAKEGISGSILAIGAAMALIMAPLAGALSDRARGARGRRRRFLVTGMIGACIGLALLVPFGAGSSILLYALAYPELAVLVELGVRTLCRPHSRCRARRRSGLGQRLDEHHEHPRHLHRQWHRGRVLRSRPPRRVDRGPRRRQSRLFGADPARGAASRPPPAAGRRFELGPFLRSFWLSPRMHRNFYRVLVTRLFANLGVWSVLTFLLFYLRDVIGVSEPGKVLPMLLGFGALLGIPASLAAARLADRYGIIAIVRATSWMMAVAAIAYVLIAFHPGIALTAPVFLVFFAGWGAYQAIDWALALKVLPRSETAGKDMGIWHVALVLPQILGPAVTGWIITGAKLAVSARFAYALAFAIAALWFSLSALLVARVELPRAA